MRRLVISVLVLVMLLGACNPATPRHTTTPVPTLTPVPAPTPTPGSPEISLRQPGGYPRLANYYHHITSIDRSQASSLAKWDLIVVHFNNVNSSPDAIRLIRQLNPRVKILVWISAGLDDGWWHRDPMMQHFDESWFLHYADSPSNPKPAQERRVIRWTDKTGANKVVGMNPASDWSTQLAQYVNDKLMKSGLFDGVFYDCAWEGVKNTDNNLDINNDGIAESAAIVSQKYLEGMTHLLSMTRELLGPEAIIFGNPGVEWSNNSPFWNYANGHMQENALGTMFGSSWPRIWEIYQRNMEKPPPPTRIHWIAADTNQSEYDSVKPELPPTDLQKMRFGLAITLLGDGYFGFDEGDGLHGQLWWFPEYNANLGLAKGDAKERTDGTWTREFDNGTVLTNPTAAPSTLEFRDVHEDVTTGTRGLSFIVPPKDGRILLTVK